MMATVDLEVVSTREAEVLDALRDHLTNAEIARRLHISVRTVESHVSSLLRKLGAADRRGLASLAAERAAQARLAAIRSSACRPSGPVSSGGRLRSVSCRKPSLPAG